MTTHFSHLYTTTTTCVQQQKGEPSSELMPPTILLSPCLLVWPADLVPGCNPGLCIHMGSLKVLHYLGYLTGH